MKKLKLEELKRLSPREMKNAPKIPLVVVLDNIRSAYNVGSIFRTSDAFRLEHIYICGISAKPPHKEIFKTAIGAQKTVDWAYYEKIVDCIGELRKKDYSIIGIEQTTESVSLDEFTFDARNEKIAVVMGNEVDGISNDILPMLDTAVEIRQYGSKHSLNVGVCAGIVLWKFAREYFNLPKI